MASKPGSQKAPIIDLTNTSESESDSSHPPRGRVGASGARYSDNPIRGRSARRGKPFNIGRAAVSRTETRVPIPIPIPIPSEPRKKHALSPATLDDGAPEKRRRISQGGKRLPSDPLQSQDPMLRRTSNSNKPATIITGQSRAEASYGVSRISPEGRVQKLRHTVGINTIEEWAKNSIKESIIPIVRAAFRKHSDTISKEMRTELGKSVTEKLVLTSLFRQNLLANRGVMSEDYVKIITKEAKKFVDEEAFKFIKSRERSLADNIENWTDKPQGLSSAGSSGEDEALEEAADYRLQRITSPPSSISPVSPPTSYSNDLTEDTTPPDPLKDSRRRRSTRTVVQSYDLVHRRRARKSRHSENVVNEPSLGVLDKVHDQTSTKPQTYADDESCHIRLEIPQAQTLSFQPRGLPPKPQPAKKTRKLVVKSARQDSRNSIAKHTPAELSPTQKPKITRFPLTWLLRQRDIDGMVPSRARRGESSFRTIATNYLEDSLVRLSEWTDCSGDIASISWTSEDTFVCGALAHYDPHNQQYNKPGNLLLGSTSQDTLRAFADHRIVRPLVAITENAENASEAMRHSQAPWLYTSVVSTAHSDIMRYHKVRGDYEPIGYCKTGGFTFTASFDKTVKVWSVSKEGIEMALCGTWNHEGNVNFVIASPHHSFVATAAAINQDAVRVYDFDENDIPECTYNSYGGNRASQQIGEQEKAWAYQPATIQWGQAHQVRNLLLVGYSPRSETGFDIDIPDDKKNTGELCVWNAETGERVTVFGAHTQNVFEVLWHPDQPIFLAATSPSGNFDNDKTKTQVRLFCLNENGIFLIIKALDCPAIDINELTIWPSSDLQCYITASCTDGNTYVWDTIQGDEAIHILEHGESLDNPAHDLPLELGDSGVKFAAWGRSSERFYTGGSDGKVKCWNVKAPARKAFIRTVLSVSGGISSGAFSKDFSQLLIGDATGKVYLLGVDPQLEEENHEQSLTLETNKRLLSYGGILPSTVRRPKVIIPHAEPEPPSDYDVQGVEETITQISRRFLDNSQLEFRESPSTGIYQGRNYSETRLFRKDAHLNNDPYQELIPEYLSKQQFQVSKKEEVLKVSRLPHLRSSDLTAHLKNVKSVFDDLDISKLTLNTKQALGRDRVELRWDRYILDYIPRSSRPSNDIFREHSTYPTSKNNKSYGNHSYIHDRYSYDSNKEGSEEDTDEHTYLS